MLNKGLKKYVSNPSIGLLPFVVYILGYVIFNSPLLNISTALVFAIVGEVTIRYFFKSRIFSAPFYISLGSLSLTLLFYLLTSGLDMYLRASTYLLFCEIITVSLFMLLKVSRTYISVLFFRQKSFVEKSVLKDFLQTASMIYHLLLVHLFLLLMDRQLRLVYPPYNLPENILFVVIPLALLLGVFFFQMFNVRKLSLKLNEEEWLPIVTEDGVVTGRIAKSISMTMKNRFLHPVVRVALISDGKVFLQERAVNDLLSPRKLDYPFEKYMLFRHEINLAARNSISAMMGYSTDISLKFLMKYVFENDNTKRLIFLFVAEVKDENRISRTDKMTGKFWSIKQIEDSFADEIFSECFELEFEYLKNMVLLAPQQSPASSLL